MHFVPSSVLQMYERGWNASLLLCIKGAYAVSSYEEAGYAR